MATHSTIFAWKIPRTEEPGRLQSMYYGKVFPFTCFILHKCFFFQSTFLVSTFNSAHIFQKNRNIFHKNVLFIGASQVALVVKNPPANAGGVRDVGSIPGLGRSPGGGRGDPLWYSCLDKSMDTGAWQATVHSVTQSRTQQCTHTYIIY